MRVKASASRILSLLVAVLLMTTVSTALLSACGGTAATTAAQSATTAAGGAATTAAVSATTTARTFNAAELATFDGKNGNKAYIAVDGIVYDVTTVAEWANRLHAGRFAPGKDYSAEIKQAPHGVDKLLKAIKVGVYKA